MLLRCAGQGSCPARWSRLADWSCLAIPHISRNEAGPERIVALRADRLYEDWLEGRRDKTNFILASGIGRVNAPISIDATYCPARRKEAPTSAPVGAKAGPCGPRPAAEANGGTGSQSRYLAPPGCAGFDPLRRLLVLWVHRAAICANPSCSTALTRVYPVRPSGTSATPSNIIR